MKFSDILAKVKVGQTFTCVEFHDTMYYETRGYGECACCHENRLLIIITSKEGIEGKRGAGCFDCSVDGDYSPAQIIRIVASPVVPN